MTKTVQARVLGLLVVVLLGAGLVACSSDDGDDAAEDGSSDASVPADSDGTADDGGAPAYQLMVEALADDALEGRDDGTPGSLAAQDLIIEQLERLGAEPVPEADPADPYRQVFSGGTNVLGVIQGTGDGAPADQVVIVGAHYDHIGTDCPTTDPADTICNGATDNAAGVAAALEVGQRIADEGGLGRTVLLAFWDIEEDGLGGSAAYLEDPAYPLAATVAYVNFDILGANLLPSLRDSTILVGAETGGPQMEAAAEVAMAAAPDLSVLPLSLLFGQGRSDHAPFAASEIPVAFLTDANPPCYHTAQDDVSVVDFDKLGEQIDVATALVQELASTDDPPTFASGLPAADHGDAVGMLEALASAEPEFERFDDEEQAAAEQFLVDLTAIVDAGEGAFDDEASGTLLAGSVDFVTALATGECDGFLED
jgi:hypothetical protein